MSSSVLVIPNNFINFIEAIVYASNLKKNEFKCLINFKKLST